MIRLGTTEIGPLAPVVIKMEDRKRPYSDDADTPPSKRQSLAVNGIQAHPDADMHYREDIDRFQKDAILRQLKEYKREANTKQASLDELSQRYKDRDDQLRVVDAWFSQLLDEIGVLLSSGLPACDDPTLKFPTSLLFEHDEKFAEHLRSRSTKIKHAITELFSRFPVASPEVTELQGRLTKLLATEKVTIAEMSALTAEKEQMSESLEKATIRYLSAEKKLDRAKSAQVAKIEAQAIQAARSEPSSATAEDGVQPKIESADLNGTSEDKAAAAIAEMKRQSLAVVAEKRTEQIAGLEAENKKLSEDVTALKIRLTGLSDEDFAASELYQLFKSQYKESIDRVNDLEARNIKLREEAQVLAAERQSHRDMINKELETSTIEMQSQLARNDADLSRIRLHRDDLMAKLTIKETVESEKRATTDQTRELTDAQQNRISVLESENERLRLRLKETSVVPASREDLEALEADALRTKVLTLEKEYELLSNELPSMAEAYKKVQAIANKKVSDLSEWEEKTLKLAAEKAKADQKYFGAMRAKESREGEIRSLRTQNAKSSEIVSQLKDAESSCRQLLIGLEKQLAEAREALTNITNQQYATKQTLNEQKITSDQLTAQITELKKMLMNKDAAIHVATHSQRQVETELEELKARQEQTQKEAENWKKKASGNSTDESDMLRALAICTVCRKNFKNTVITTCGHLFCQECVDDRMTNRSRKCPNCGKSFGKGDHMRVTL